MSLVNWSSKYVTGHMEVDNQHQELFRMVNTLHDAILTGKGKEVMVKTLDGLAAYVVKHFKMEEALMLKVSYPAYAHHKAIHDKLTKDAVDIINGYKSGKMVLTITLSQFLNDWITKHIEVEDIKMINFVKSNK